MSQHKQAALTQKGVGGDGSRKHHMVLQRTVPIDTHKHVCRTENYPQRKVKRPAGEGGAPLFRIFISCEKQPSQ